ncbi:MAG: hypothetical protein IKW95_08255 [Lachnospiraceae bacterium]|nr:hypothetical protein [Lachnospiraceae bacterium]
MEESNKTDKETKKKRRRKRTLIVLAILAALILLTPIPYTIKDGGTKHYSAILYSVYDYHALWMHYYRNTETNELRYSILRGIAVDILGIKVYDGTWEDRPTGSEWEQISADEYDRLRWEQYEEEQR